MNPHIDEPQTLETRVTELEELLTHQQRTLEQLNEVVLEQERRLKAIQASMLDLNNELTEVSEWVAENRPTENEETPPHY